MHQLSVLAAIAAATAAERGVGQWADLGVAKKKFEILSRRRGNVARRHAGRKLLTE